MPNHTAENSTKIRNQYTLQMMNPPKTFFHWPPRWLFSERKTTRNDAIAGIIAGSIVALVASVFLAQNIIGILFSTAIPAQITSTRIDKGRNGPVYKISIMYKFGGDTNLETATVSAEYFQKNINKQEIQILISKLDGHPTVDSEYIYMPALFLVIAIGAILASAAMLNAEQKSKPTAGKCK